MSLTTVSWMHFAGPAWAGEVRGSAGTVAAREAPQAWVAEYRIRDAGVERTLVLVRSDTQVEHRMPGEPVRAWQKIGDGVEHREIFAAQQRVVVYAPGDLRALGQSQDWARLGGLVDPALLAGLKDAGSTRTAGQVARRLRGVHEGDRIDLDWIAGAELPARYRRVGPQGRFQLELRTLQRVPAAAAFASTDGYRELDYADIGDMELDPFARQYIRQGF
jgi:hypothetical protein